MLSKKDIEELATGAVKRYFNTCNLGIFSKCL